MVVVEMCCEFETRFCGGWTDEGDGLVSVLIFRDMKVF